VLPQQFQWLGQLAGSYANTTFLAVSSAQQVAVRQVCWQLLQICQLVHATANPQHAQSSSSSFQRVRFLKKAWAEYIN
jgi:hypothetical protein